MISFLIRKLITSNKKIYNHFINDNWVNGNIVKKFEKKLKRFIKTKHNVISCNRIRCSPNCFAIK